MLAILLDIIYLAFPLACILAIPQGTRIGSVAERIVLGVALYQFLLLAFGLTLGLTNHLTAPIYALAIGCTTLLLGIQGFRNGMPPPVFRMARYIRTWRGRATLLMICVATVALVLELGFDFTYGTRHGDGLEYHIPRVTIWAQQGNFDPWPTPVAASIGLPVGADLILLHKILLNRGWGGAGYVTFLLSMGATACVYLAGMELGLRKWHAAMAALLFISFPAIGLRIWSVNSDIAAAFPALASFVVLHRIHKPGIGLALFVLLNATALSCKPTVAPPALILACVTLWLCRDKFVHLRRNVLPYAATILGALLVVASYWPVYLAFSDFFGGDYSRVHRSATIMEFLHGVAMHTGYWLLEPLGYFTRFREQWEVEAVGAFYRALGANFSSLPENWKPYPGQDTGYTGLATVLALPILFKGLSSKARNFAILVFLLCYIPLSGMIHPQPFFSRYNVLLLAGVALLWGGSKIFAQGKRRWLLTGLVALNLSALLGAVSINVHLHRTRWSQPGGHYFYLSDEDRQVMAETLEGGPLLLMAESSERGASLDALLPGPRSAFPLQYVVCPADGDWGNLLRISGGQSHWLALVHNGRETMIPGPVFQRPGSHTCSEVSKRSMEEALTDAGWALYRSNNIVDLWRFR